MLALDCRRGDLRRGHRVDHVRGVIDQRPRVPAVRPPMSLRSLRESAGLTQAQLAERVGCTAPVIGHYETRSRISRARLIEPLAAALGVSPAQVLEAVSIAEARKTTRVRVEMPADGRCGDCHRRVYASMGPQRLPSALSVCQWCARPDRKEPVE